MVRRVPPVPYLFYPILTRVPPGLFQVNRLTRELSLLRAQQSASVASNTSSTSTGHPDAASYTTDSTSIVHQHSLSGPIVPSTSQRPHHRSSSSSTSIRSTTGPTSLHAGNVPATTSQSGSIIAPPRGVARDIPSRQNSATSSRRSGASSPSLLSSAHSSLHHPGEGHFASQYYSHHRTSLPSHHHPVVVSSPGLGSGGAAEEGLQRVELEAVRRENEVLRRRVRELERMVGERGGPSDDTGRGGREARGSDRTGRDGGRDGEDESVGVGESAGSVGVGGGH